jgi:glutaredoxin domain-containing cysteine-rich protein 1
MTIKTLKARILRVLRSSLPAAAASASPPPSPTKPGRVVVLASDAVSDDASFFDAHETPTKINLPAEPIDDGWELVDQDGDNRDSRASAPASAPDFDDLLREFPARCPPGGEEAVVLYTTTLRGIRKTFEDCNEVRALLENLAAAFQERDVSMDRGLREQLWAATGEKAVPPRLFVRGRDIGGAAQVLALHEDGRLVSLLQSPSPPAKSASGNKKKEKCDACGGLSFVVCGQCDGSRKVFDGEHGGVRCRGCNENGLVMCTLCSYPS